PADLVQDLGPERRFSAKLVVLRVFMAVRAIHHDFAFLAAQGCQRIVHHCPPDNSRLRTIEGREFRPGNEAPWLGPSALLHSPRFLFDCCPSWALGQQSRAARVRRTSCRHADDEPPGCGHGTTGQEGFGQARIAWSACPRQPTATCSTTCCLTT